MEFKTLSIEDIEFSVDNPRLTFVDESLEELSDSIKRDGIIQPIIVKPNGSKYKLVVGERRVRAAIRANIPKLPAIIRDDISNEEASRLRLTENINRKDLDPFERVNGIKAHMEKYGLSLEQMAMELNKKPETVKGWFHLEEATSPKIKIVDNFIRKLGTQKLMEIAKYNFETQETLAEKIVEHDLTVDQVRRFITLFESNPDADLDMLVTKVRQQVKTIEVTLPVEEAEQVLKRSKEIRKKEEKAEKKLKKLLRKRIKPQQIRSTEPDFSKESNDLIKSNTTERSQTLASVNIPIELPSIKKVRETEVAKLAEAEKLTTDEVKRLTELDKAESTLSPRELVETVKKEMRPQIMVLEIQPKMHDALEAYSNSEKIFVKEAVLMLLEEGLENHGYWERGKGK